MTGVRRLDRYRLAAMSLATMAAITTFLQPTYAQETTTVDAVRPQLAYSLDVSAENLFVRINVNGAPLVLHGRLGPMQATIPITDATTLGENVVTFELEPFDIEQQKFVPHEGVAFQALLNRQSDTFAQTQLAEAVTLFSGRYDQEKDTLLQDDMSAFGQGPVVRRSGGLSAGPVTLSEATIVYSNRVSDGHGLRLEARFQIDDTPMPTPPWIGAPDLRDRPDLMRDLEAAYRKLHGILAAGDGAAWRAQLHAVYAHRALVLGYPDADALADAVLSRDPITATGDERLAAFDPQLSTIEFGPDGRLARLAPDPLAYLADDGSETRAYGVFFCADKNGLLVVCFMQDIPY